MAKDMKIHFVEGNIEIVNRYMKMGSIKMPLGNDKFKSQ